MDYKKQFEKDICKKCEYYQTCSLYSECLIEYFESHLKESEDLLKKACEYLHDLVEPELHIHYKNYYNHIQKIKEYFKKYKKLENV